jgi:hypothetical protein
VAVDWPAIFQWVAGGLSAGGGWRLIDVFALRRPRQNAALDKAIRDELREDNRLFRAENQQLEKQLAEQAVRMAELARFEQEIVARLMAAGVDRATIKKIIKRARSVR